MELMTAEFAGNTFAEVLAREVETLVEQPHWYAVCTCANREKRVAEQLAFCGIDHYLPQYDSVRRWKDRKVRLQLPLFPGYVFVHFALQRRLSVLQVPGVARIVGFGGVPTPLPDKEVPNLRAALESHLRAEPHPFLTSGRRVRVKQGPLMGVEGLVVRRKNRMRIVILLELI